ncbi:growth-regulating factor 6-like isoform X1 [Rhododendron vialii]|uniref:growth-regulating factor 6-like isoform X1 n=1 Tax=Rhododendron vialii TaxID=182163 RepID=UPI00265D97FB|nr:growth-regulating factor 6-like isoform X1 [Rhododendron vialii]
MDLGMLGFEDSVVGSSPPPPPPPCLVSDPETKQKWYHGSGLPKQERSAAISGCTEQQGEYWRASKVAKTDEYYYCFSGSKAMQQQQNRSPLLRSNTTLFSDGQQMLSFSSPNSSNSEETVTLPNYYHPTSNSYSRNNTTGYDMSGVFTGVRGLFTPSQWMELEHQALIYKYITANVPIPSNLLIPIRKALDSAGFSCFSGGLLVPNTLGWGTFRLGYANSTDPEPGRCRRTDGKKWRCSRDAVTDQKYCERHMNRGRHRSRKPVEGGQTGHSVAGSTTTTKFMSMTTSASASLVTGRSTTNGLGLSHHPQLKNLQQPGATNPSASSPNSRNFLNKENAGNRIQGDQFSIPKQPNPYEESTRAEFGCVYSDSLLNPLHKTSDSMTESQHSVRQFIDDWPKNPTDRSSISWPTQLSISIPMTASDFTSSTSSPINGKMAHSPLRLSRDLETDSTQMGLGVGSQNQRQANWIPISRETSMGGPLGEVLHRTNSGVGDQQSTSALNLMTDGWDHSPRLGSSPTGVLQKMAFGSVSNSSAGSSPRPENHLSSN